jgi:hypothetical protein
MQLEDGLAGARTVSLHAQHIQPRRSFVAAGIGEASLTQNLATIWPRPTIL